ncbi:ribosomal protein S6e-domain-containing protein [Mycena maculata]|uniref:Ribosomal protein S6e-domain-containing protein n=1 Tax=Mycena maculata TaxID=230809 RepID=A0AAD7JAQ1_9AGAR|nr:ribosomal protein S6e-domain-containing protein [Mycena maculata]
MVAGRIILTHNSDPPTTGLARADATDLANPASLKAIESAVITSTGLRDRIFYDKKLAQEVPADSLEPEWAGYLLCITGGNDKQGFPMKQGVLLLYRVKLLLADSHLCYRARCTGEHKRKSVHGCIVGPDIAVLSVVLVKQGEGEIAGLYNDVLPKRLGPKRATKIKRCKEDDVQRYVVRREVTPKKEGGKPYTKAPKIQRLVTPICLQRRRHLRSLVRRRSENQKEQKAEFDILIAKRIAEKKANVAALKAAHHK